MNKYLVCLLIILMGFSTAWAVETEHDRVMQIPKLDGKLTLDGQFKEAVWENGALCYKLAYINETSKPAKEFTQVCLWYDDNNLYLGWTCRDKDIAATYTKHDSMLWEEEVVEFFVSPRKIAPIPGTVDYFELQWNPLGTMFDAIIHNKVNAEGWSQKMEGDWDWNAKGMQCAVQVQGTVAKSSDRDKKWQVEVKIPFAALNQETPQKGDIWYGNFYRYSRNDGKIAELQSWNPTTTPSFHEPKQFGKIVFK